MRRENHRRTGVYRKSSGGWGHRAVYVGAVVATAALIAGFGAALLAYGPLGTPVRSIAGTTAGLAPKGVVLGTASETFASQLNLNNASAPGAATWNWTNATGGFNGPCNASGILNQTNGSYIPYDTNNSTNASAPLQNLSANGNSTTLVCLNSVNNGLVNATWYYAQNGSEQTYNSYNSTNWVANGSSYNSSAFNIPSCSNWTSTNFTNWTEYHEFNTTYNSFIPCSTYFEMNNNTTYLTSFGGSGNATGGYNNSSLWSPNQTGYLPSDVVYALPVIFENSSVNGTYEISVAIQGVTPVAQTFFFNDTIGNTTLQNDTVLFVFDMTVAWLMDLSLNMTGNTTNGSALVVYGSIGTASIIVSECAQLVCPIEAPVFV